MRTFIDISRTISNDVLQYPGDPALEMKQLCTISPGCPCNVTTLQGWSTHFLTHVDAPYHFYNDRPALCDMPLERFAGACRVVDVAAPTIDAALVRSLGDVKGQSILFKTKNSAAFRPDKYVDNPCYIDADAATLLADGGVNLVGIDYYSVDHLDTTDYPAHYALLGASVIILENIDLKNVAPGAYEFSALPLKIDGKYGDGSPVRAVLREVA